MPESDDKSAPKLPPKLTARRIMGTPKAEATPAAPVTPAAPAGPDTVKMKKPGPVAPPAEAAAEPIAPPAAHGSQRVRKSTDNRSPTRTRPQTNIARNSAWTGHAAACLLDSSGVGNRTRSHLAVATPFPGEYINLG